MTQFNPATNVSYRDLDTYLRSKLEGKKILEIRQQDCKQPCRPTIMIRYEE